MRRLFSPEFLNVTMFCAVLSVFGAILLFTPRAQYSESERRLLETFPNFNSSSVITGEFTRQLNVYYSDTVPKRNTLMDISAKINNMKGIRTDDVRLFNLKHTNITDIASAVIAETDNARSLYEMTPAGDDQSVDEYSTSTDRKYTNDADVSYEAAENINKPNKYIEETLTFPEGVANIANNGILVFGTRALMLYGGSIEMGTRYADALNKYKERLDDNINVYCMLIPTAVEFYCPQDYRRLSGDQRKNINHIHDSLNDLIIPVPAYTALSNHIDEEIYLRTDHHWAPLGAYYAAKEFSSISRTPFTPLYEYTEVIIPDYVGTMYGYSGDITIKNNPEDFVYYKPPNKYETVYYEYKNPETPISAPLFLSMNKSNSYSTFMGGDAKITHISTDIKNGRKLTVLKESFGNALIPFFVGSFEEIYVIDIRYFPYKVIPFIEEKGVTDVLFANNIFAANSKAMIEYIESIME